LEEFRPHHGTEEYRAVQDLVRRGSYQEALERATEAIHGGRLGRRYAARLHSLCCWLYVVALENPSPAAVLHGEEAVRLADLLNDEWIRCEALTRLIPAYCQVGDAARAEEGCDRLAREVERNEMVVSGGWSGLWSIRAQAALAAGDAERALRYLDRAVAAADREIPGLVDRLQRQQATIRAWYDLGAFELTVQGRGLLQSGLEGDGDRAHRVRSVAAEALCGAPENRLTALVQAREALNRAIELGRADLARQVRDRLAHLL